MKKERIEEIINDKILSIETLENGLTNNNYKVTTPTQCVIVRIPRPENTGLFDYEHERKVLTMIEPLNIDTEHLYYDPLTGIKVSPYIENVQHYSSDYKSNAVALLKKLHSLERRSGKTFDIVNLYTTYKQRVRNRSYDTIAALPFIYEAKILAQKNPTLCHNDCVEGNFMFTPHHDYLIDYEYASDNHPYFDLMSLITENNIDDSNERMLIYTQYLGHYPTQKDIHLFNIFEIAQSALWCEWAMMMQSNHDNPLYEEIAKKKYNDLNRSLSREG